MNSYNIKHNSHSILWNINWVTLFGCVNNIMKVGIGTYNLLKTTGLCLLFICLIVIKHINITLYIVNVIVVVNVI